MHDSLLSLTDAFGHTWLALAVGAAVIVLVALAIERQLIRVVFRRVLWQAVFLALAALLTWELTGAHHVIGGLVAVIGSPTNAPRVAVFAAQAMDAEPSVIDSTLADDEAHVFAPEPLVLARVWQDNSSEFVSAWADGNLAKSADARPASALCETLVALAEGPAADSEGETPMAVAVAAGVALGLWCCGTCLLIGRVLMAHQRLVFARRHWPAVDDAELAPLIDELGRRIGLRRPVRVCQAAGLPAAVAYGLFRPTVLLPSDFTQRFAPAQQQVMLAHELAHLSARDPDWLVAAEVMTALLWWHPLVRVARRRLETAAEQAADEASVLVPDGPNILADCLVQLGQRLTRQPRFGWVAAEGGGLRSGLAGRVERLLKLTDQHHPIPHGRITAIATPVVAVLLMLLTISCTLWVYPKATFAKGENTMNVLKDSWRRSLAAAAMTAFLVPAASGAAAEEPPAGPPQAAQLADRSLVDAPLLAQRGDEERAREREARGDRERGEQREWFDAQRKELGARAEQIEREKAELLENTQREAGKLEEALQNQRAELEKRAQHVAELEKKLANLKKDVQEEDANDEVRGLAEELDKAIRVHSELAKQARNVERELDEHRANALGRLADLEQELKKVHGRIERIAAEPVRGDGKQAEALERIQAMDRQLHQLRQTGKHEEAERLQQDMMRLHDQFIGPRDRERPDGQQRERREGRERFEQMTRQLQQLREAGRHDAAEELQRDIQELDRRLTAGARESDRPGPQPELTVRIDHLRVAMDHLHAAGLHDQAKQIGLQIERFVRELPPEARERGMLAPGPRPGTPPSMPGDVGNELRSEIERLRRESDEMRRTMNELRDGQERLLHALKSKEGR